MAIGFEALLSGGAGIAIGDRAMRGYTGPTASIGIGNLVMQSFTGSESIAIGGGRSLTASNFNTIVGYNACDILATGSHNSIFGRDGFIANVSGSRNTGMGSNVGNTVTGDGNVLLGYSVASGQTAISNQLWIDNSNTSTPLIWGDFSSNEIVINGSHEVTKAIRTSAVETITASSDTLDDTNHIVLCDCTSNAITINLPAASGNTGLTYIIKKTDSTGNAVTVDGSGSEAIDGATTKAITTQYDYIRIVCDGSNWFIV